MEKNESLISSLSLKDILHKISSTEALKKICFCKIGTIESVETLQLYMLNAKHEALQSPFVFFTIEQGKHGGGSFVAVVYEKKVLKSKTLQVQAARLMGKINNELPKEYQLPIPIISVRKK